MIDGDQSSNGRSSGSFVFVSQRIWRILCDQPGIVDQTEFRLKTLLQMLQLRIRSADLLFFINILCIKIGHRPHRGKTAPTTVDAVPINCHGVGRRKPVGRS
jgi:hypothetical protein